MNAHLAQREDRIRLTALWKAFFRRFAGVVELWIFLRVMSGLFEALEAELAAAWHPSILPPIRLAKTSELPACLFGCGLMVSGTFYGQGIGSANVGAETGGRVG